MLINMQVEYPPGSPVPSFLHSTLFLCFRIIRTIPHIAY
jgi:hypothetical protein